MMNSESLPSNKENDSPLSIQEKESYKEVIETIGMSAEFILTNAVDSVLHIGRDGTIIKLNSIASAILGYEKTELSGKNIFSLIPVDYHFFIKARVPCSPEDGENEICCSKTEELFLLRFPDSDGVLNSYECIIFPYTEDDKVSFFLNMWIPDHSKNELFNKLKEAQGNYEALTETITEAVIMVDESFQILYANTSCKRVFGYSRDELIGSPFAMLFPAEVFSRYSSEFKKYFYMDSQEDQTVKKELEVLGRSKNRGVSPLEISFGNSRELEQRTIICIIRDISQRKNVERKLRYLAYHDKLTELGNRDLFHTDIEEFFRVYKSHQQLCGALLFLDLDGFKQVNDTLGHQAGDMLLISTAKRLRGLLRESDMIYRFGGDEFVILITKLNKQSDVELICRKILQVIQRSYNFEKNRQSHKVNIGVSIGVALLPNHGNDEETVTRQADLAMYKSKESGKNRFTIFSEELTLSAQNKWLIDQGLKTALVNQEMFLLYQPIVDKSGNISGVEALIRWNHPDQGLISPDEFIPSAEESGLIIPIGRWVLEHALLDIKELNRIMNRDLYVSANVSTRQLMAPDFPEIVDRAIKRSGIKLKNLRLELTESFIMESPDHSITVLEKLKEDHPGLKIVIDDFGKGYSSLHYLSRLPVDVIKIDRSFIKEIPADNNRKVINSIINLATSLDLGIVAEGIETEEQRDYPPLNSCQYMQGYLFSKPLTYKELLKFLNS
ncbi:EAL domain-containing protein [Oceanispirochaeta sp. M1]|uniref:sensor domain-containing protein n=1 Tax=Oceanispirochaeta sp. M1 TaxID=2283433 RepID=UPI000E090164|nr:EAL domain-containing protein [Oceanispirochaeta sp. M1]NPD74309.1 EAL domain-containing protein [Oceanispirochaeta sp. M1]RDG29895.1 EAL domain-containing protein [Oceanispirochaeta sp. M1]